MQDGYSNVVLEIADGNLSSTIKNSSHAKNGISSNNYYPEDLILLLSVPTYLYSYRE